MDKTKQIINKLQNIYGDKYDYSLIEYTSSKDKIKIICSKHGVFESRIDHLLEGKGCKLCRKEEKLVEKQKKFIEKAKQVHGDKYDYSKVEYINSETKVCIICPKHGEFWQSPINHINQKQGCAKCYHESKMGVFNMSTIEFIEKAKQVHGDKYDYSNTIYKGLKNKLKIICPFHSEFEQIAYDHLRGYGCEKCKYMKNTFTTEQFIKRAKQIHCDKYDYSKTIYVNENTKVCIICPTHGEFWQRPINHLLSCGCPKCQSSHLEIEMRNVLKNHSIIFEEQKHFVWLGQQSLDFYIPSKNIAIECQGEQHFKPIEYFGGEKRFKKRIENDLIKNNLCKQHNIKILYYSNLGIIYPYNVYENTEKIIKTIMES